MSIKLNAKSKVTTATNSVAASAITADAAIKRADELCVAREKYETETLARSNKELYGILGSVYALFKQAVGAECIKDTVKAMRAPAPAQGRRRTGQRE